MSDVIIGEIVATLVTLARTPHRRQPGSFISSWPRIDVSSSWTRKGQFRVSAALVLTQEPMSDTAAVEEDRFEIEIVGDQLVEAREVISFETMRSISGGPLDEATWARVREELEQFVEDRWRG